MNITKPVSHELNKISKYIVSPHKNKQILNILIGYAVRTKCDKDIVS